VRRTNLFAICAIAWVGGCQLLSGVDDLVYTAGSGVAGGGGLGGAGGTPKPDGGMGGTECAQASDCPGIETTCQYRICDDGHCAIAEADAGTPCTEDDGSFCDGVGSCVECLTPNHCEPEFTCQAKQCIPLSCVNRELDPSEADVDCGGICPRCENGASCATFQDCKSGFCDAGAGSGGAGASGGGAGSAGDEGGAGGHGGDSEGECAPCANHADCADAPNAHCDAGSCVPQLALGAVCAETEACLSGHCVDGRCCDGACEGSCVACLGAQTTASDGICAPVKAGTDPGGECLGQGPTSCGAAGQGCNGDAVNPSCILYDATTVCVAPSCDPSLNEETLAASCDGMGTCDAPVVQSCFPYACNAAATACNGACTGDGDCATDGYCLSNACLPRKTQGASCSAANQCLSGHCVDGRCCESSCGGTCRACSQAKTGQPNGACAFIPNNQDPDNECLLSCNGTGACQLAAN
jgi:hypothetical protein